MASTETTAREQKTLINPHGGTLVDRTVSGDQAAALAEEAAGLPSVRLTEKQTADLDMIASGALSPLTGFMNKADYESTVEDMHLAGGLAWAIPVTLSTDGTPSGDRLALEGYEGGLLAVLDVEEVFEADRRNEAVKVFRTDEEAHPGVAQIYAEGSTLVGGPVTVFQRPEPAFPALHMDPVETRAAFAERGWSRVVGFQTRNPCTGRTSTSRSARWRPSTACCCTRSSARPRATTCPQRCASSATACCSTGTTRADRTLLAAFPAAMRYAGPREAVWHAICRKNYGCSHFIVGRDHAGVGSYYGTYDAHLIFDEFEPQRARHRADVLRPHVLLQDVRLDGLGQDLPARSGAPRLPVRDEGARDARQGRGSAGRVHPARGGRGADRRLPRPVTQQRGQTPLLQTIAAEGSLTLRHRWVGRGAAGRVFAAHR